jgi:hypothetical protein
MTILRDSTIAARVEDAPATRSEADYNFISNDYVAFGRTSARRHPALRVLPGTQTIVETPDAHQPRRLSTTADVGAPDYSDQGMLQYLRTERIVPYQTRGYAGRAGADLEVGTEPRR